MAFFFGDGFDLYTAITDCGTYWDAGFGGTVTLGLNASGRFTGSRGLGCGSGFGGSGNPYIFKTSNVNDAVHHISLAVQQTTAIAAASMASGFTLYDGANVQCSVMFRADGSLALATQVSGNGTVLATYNGAIAAQNTWYQFEIEIVIHNTAGSIAVRKLGNTSNDFFLGSLNTRNGSTNNYANKIAVSAVLGTVGHVFDDFLWRSDAASLAWLGDIRCYTRMPASDASVTWSQSGSPNVQQNWSGTSTNASISNTTIRFQPYTSNYTSSITTVTFVTSGSAAGNIKGAIWADNAGQPGAVLASMASQPIVAAGNNVFSLSTPLAVVAGQKIWIGALSDTAVGTWNTTSGSTGGTASGSFATFPQANPVMSGSGPLASSITFGFSGNWGRVAEPQQDGATTYVYSSTVGQSDLYGIASISATPGSIVGVTTRAYMEKSDAGTRIAAVQLQSGSSNVQGSLTLNTTWGWAFRNDLVDPATSAAWTATGVNNAQIGVTVTA